MSIATRLNGKIGKNGRATKSPRPDLAPIVDPESTAFDPAERHAEVEIGRGLTAQLAWVTPDLAAGWSARVGKIQRNKKRLHLRSLVEDLRAGRFRLNGETIVFDSDGSLIDGQHRLASVIESGVPILTVVIRGVPPAAYATLGNTAKRTGSDALRSEGYANTVVLAAAANLLRRYERNMIAGMGGATEILVLSPVAVEEAVRAHPGLAESVRVSMAAGRQLGAMPAAAFCHYVLSGVDADDAARFFDKVATGEELRKGDPVLALRNRAREEKINRDELVHLVFKAWNNARKGIATLLLRRGNSEALPRPI